MLEHYHNVNSVCAQKVRIALAEKGLDVKEHLLTLRGDQHDPAYRKLNPNGVVPTLVHDGRAIIESALILYYLDEAFPDHPLMPKEPLLRHRVRLYNKLVDEYVHNSCMILTFATAFRPNFLKMPREDWLAEINKTPLKRRAEYKRSVIERGLESEFVADGSAQKTAVLDGSVAAKRRLSCGRYLFQRRLCRRSVSHEARTSEAKRHVGSLSGYRRLVDASARETVRQGTEADWAPFKNLASDPWPTVQTIMMAA